MLERRRRSSAQSPTERFRRLWRGTPAPDLKHFLSTLPAPTADVVLDLVEIDRYERWHRGEKVRAERYLREFPVLAEDVESTLVVIYGEYYLRKEMGETPSLMEYIARFPQHARRLRDQVMWHEAIELGRDPTPIGGGPPEIPGLAIGDLLGQGGMCAVYQATEADTNRTVAVKVLDAAHLSHLLRVARFRREIESVMRLNHPHIVPAYRTGEAYGLPYLVMEYCDGGTLAGYLRKHLVLPQVASGILRDLAGAVEYAHRHGIVHRDLKPANVLLTKPIEAVFSPAPAASVPVAMAAEAVGVEMALETVAFPYVAKVSDFGLAKFLQSDKGAITGTREALGTPCYMAPELTHGARDADARTDVYGLAAILYEMLTGSPPFYATSPMEVLRMVREDTPIPPSSYDLVIPEELMAICLRCLAKNSDDRYQSAAALADALAAWELTAGSFEQPDLPP